MHGSELLCQIKRTKGAGGSGLREAEPRRPLGPRRTIGLACSGERGRIKVER